MASTSELKRNSNGKAPAGRPLTAKTADRHVLYEASVQCVEADVDFMLRVYKAKNRRNPTRLREDFCGTAALACDFVNRNKANEAWGVDLHEPTLQWGLEHNALRQGVDMDRLILMKEDVLTAETPPVDMVAAFNFSYSVFKTREVMVRYFKNAHRALRAGGLFYVDMFGGTEAFDTLNEERKIPAAIGADGMKRPAFTYVWRQAKFNTITHEILCHIDFKFADGTRMSRAFTYDWRLWSVPELQEMLHEAGFRSSEVYMEGWDDESEDGDGIFRRRTFFENREGWVGYVIGIR